MPTEELDLGLSIIGTVKQIKKLDCQRFISTHLSSQKKLLSPEPTLKQMLSIKSYITGRISFNKAECLQFGSFKLQPFLEAPYLALMILLHRPVEEFPSLHNHLPKRALFIFLMGLKPKPPFALGLQTEAQSTKCIFFSKPPCHKKLCCKPAIIQFDLPPTLGT